MAKFKQRCNGDKHHHREAGLLKKLCAWKPVTVLRPLQVAELTTFTSFVPNLQVLFFVTYFMSRRFNHFSHFFSDVKSLLAVIRNNKHAVTEEVLSGDECLTPPHSGLGSVTGSPCSSISDSLGPQSPLFQDDLSSPAGQYVKQQGCQWLAHPTSQYYCTMANLCVEICQTQTLLSSYGFFLVDNNKFQ